jgi:hypothetical protein
VILRLARVKLREQMIVDEDALVVRMEGEGQSNPVNAPNDTHSAQDILSSEGSTDRGQVTQPPLQKWWMKLQTSFRDIHTILKNHIHSYEATHLMHLGIDHYVRFEHLGNISDLEKAIVAAEGAVQLACDDHPVQIKCLKLLSISQHSRFKQLGDLSDLENAIMNEHQAINLTDDADQIKASLLSNLGDSL